MSRAYKDSCIFCSFADEEESDVFSRPDTFPVAPGHTLVIPRAHVETFFDAPRALQASLMNEVIRVKSILEKELSPDGYNVGFNCGIAAGQTIMHLHIHVIPRYSGDMDDPRGGVRHVIPEKGNYTKW